MNGPPVVGRNPAAGDVTRERRYASRYIFDRGPDAARDLLDRQRAAIAAYRLEAARTEGRARGTAEWNAQRIEVSAEAMALELGLAAVTPDPANEGDGWETAYVVEDLRRNERMLVQTHPTQGVRTVAPTPF